MRKPVPARVAVPRALLAAAAVALLFVSPHLTRAQRLQALERAENGPAQRIGSPQSLGQHVGHGESVRWECSPEDSSATDWEILPIGDED